jgi:hypothetical protein
MCCLRLFLFLQATEEQFSASYPNVRTVAIKKGNQSLGIMIIEGKHAEVGQGIFISDIQEGSFAEKAGLEIGEMILAVNKDSLVGSNYDTVSIRKSSRYLLFLLFSFRPLAVSAVRPSFVRFLPRRLFTLLLYPHQLCNIFTVLILIFHNTPLC